MSFGNEFRKKHKYSKKYNDASALNTYAKDLMKKINESNFDNNDTLFINSSLSKEQIDYLQIKLNVCIRRLNDKEIEICPFLEPDIIVDGWNEDELFSMTKLFSILFSLLSCPVIFSIIDWELKINSSVLSFIAIVGTIIVSAIVAVILAVSVVSVLKYFVSINYIKKLKNKFKL